VKNNTSKGVRRMSFRPAGAVKNNMRKGVGRTYEENICGEYMRGIYEDEENI
jgi:hypothetical protein